MAIAITDLTNWNKINIEVYTTIEEKLNALLGGNILLVRGFEQMHDADVLVRLVDVKGQKVSQVSFDTLKPNLADLYWRTFDVGINSLSLLEVYKVTDLSVFTELNKFKVGDAVAYVSEDGLFDSAIVLEVYKHKTEENVFAYKLSREPDYLYEEDKIRRVG
ncbi:hypothetical protein vBBceHLY2_00075 [Bacillus phage vB_BceH_LY2]|nr:hypothetical protein vBBceHLY2_00075 [Bacillus phage vB_BceH_LY2]